MDDDITQKLHKLFASRITDAAAEETSRHTMKVSIEPERETGSSVELEDQ